MESSLAHRAWLGLALVLVAAVALSACDLLTGSDRPEEMRVIASHQDLGEPVQMITSREFYLVVSSEAGHRTPQFISADTLLVELPMDSTFQMAPTYHLAVRFMAPEEEPDPIPSITLDVSVDGADVWSGTQIMFPGSHIEFYVQDVRR